MVHVIFISMFLINMIESKPASVLIRLPRGVLDPYLEGPDGIYSFLLVQLLSPCLAAHHGGHYYQKQGNYGEDYVEDYLESRDLRRQVHDGLGRGRPGA